MKKLILTLFVFLFIQQTLSAQKTVKIWIVRHAEKETRNPNDKDPDLTPEGYERAEALKKYLNGNKPDSIFATDYKRTKLTAFPLADKIGISIKTYDAKTQAQFAKQLIRNAGSKKILIVGHSNTVLDLIEAFGAQKPVKELTEEDYDYIFALTVKGDKAEVKVDRYGKEHHQQ